MPDGSGAAPIQEFMVNLGYRVDQSQQNKFKDALKENHLSIEKIGKGMQGIIDQFAFLATSATGAAIGLSSALIKVAGDMASLGFQSQRIGSGAGDVRAISEAFERMGISADHARAMMEGVANAARLNPGLLQAFGVSQGATVTEAMVQLADRWQKLIAQGATGMSQAVQEASRLGIAQIDMLAMVRPEFRSLYEEQRKLQALHGLNMEQLTKQSIELTRHADNLAERFANFGLYIEQTWGPKLDNELQKVNHWFEEHTPQINRYLDGMSNNFDSFTGSVSRWYQGLSPTTQDTLEKVGVFAAGALALKQASGLTSFLARMIGMGSLSGPLGALVGLGGGILLLANDYNTWKATGGQDSLIDWSKWEPTISAATKAIGNLNSNYIGPLFDKLGMDRGLLPAFEGLAAYLGGAAFLGGIKAGLGWVLRALAMIPGSGVTGAMLSPLGLAIEAPLALKGDEAKRTPEQEKALQDRTNKEVEEYMKAHPGYKPPEGYEKLLHKSAYTIGGGAGSPELVALVTTVVAIMRRLYGDTGGSGGAANSNDFEQGSARLIQAMYRGPGAGGGGGPVQEAAFRVPGLAGSGGPVPGDVQERANYIIDQFREKLGLSAEQASGIAGRFMSESHLDPNAFNPKGGGHGAAGIAQWRAERQEALAQFMQENPDLSNFQAQVQFSIKEMMEKYPDVLAGIKRQSTPSGSSREMFNYEKGEPYTKDWGSSESERLFKGYHPSPSQGGFGPGGNVHNVNITAPTTVQVTGVSDANRAAQLVDNNLDRKNANLIRHLRTAYL